MKHFKKQLETKRKQLPQEKKSYKPRKSFELENISPDASDMERYSAKVYCVKLLNFSYSFVIFIFFLMTILLLTNFRLNGYKEKENQ